jgi:hypothetical protein
MCDPFVNRFFGGRNYVRSPLTHTYKIVLLTFCPFAADLKFREPGLKQPGDPGTLRVVSVHPFPSDITLVVILVCVKRCPAMPSNDCNACHAESCLAMAGAACCPAIVCACSEYVRGACQRKIGFPVLQGGCGSGPRLGLVRLGLVSVRDGSGLHCPHLRFGLGMSHCYSKFRFHRPVFDCSRTASQLHAAALYFFSIFTAV